MSRQFQVDEFAFETASERIFSEVDGFVFEDALKAEVFSLEYGRFRLGLYHIYLVDGLLRDYKMARDEHCNRVKTYGMSHCTHSRTVLAEFREVAVAYQAFLSVLFFFLLR